jgi:uncharacterized damage-inducible protein DinB
MKTETTLKQILLKETETVYAATEKLFQKVSNGELSWKPSTGINWMTMGQLLMHCASFGCGKAVQGFVTGKWDFLDEEEPGDENAVDHFPPAEALPYVKSVEQALELLADDRELSLRYLDEVKETDLLNKRLAAPWGGPELALFQHLSFMIDHLAQHKGQLFYYLKLMGKDMNTIDLWGV